MKLILDTLDISEYVNQKIDIAETPTYVDGLNLGTAKTGVPIFNRIHTRYSLSIPLKPLPQSVYSQIISKCELNEMSVEYTSARAVDTIGAVAQCSLSQWKYATEWAGQRIYHGCTLTVNCK